MIRQERRLTRQTVFRSPSGLILGRVRYKFNNKKNAECCTNILNKFQLCHNNISIPVFSASVAAAIRAPGPLRYPSFGPGDG